MQYGGKWLVSFIRIYKHTHRLLSVTLIHYWCFNFSILSNKSDRLRADHEERVVTFGSRTVQTKLKQLKGFPTDNESQRSVEPKHLPQFEFRTVTEAVLMRVGGVTGAVFGSFRVLLMMAVLFCCGAGFFIRRRMYPYPLRDEPAFNVSFTRHTITTPGNLILTGTCWKPAAILVLLHF